MNVSQDSRGETRRKSGSSDRDLTRAVDIGRIVRCLLHYPYYCVIQSPGAPEDEDILPRLAKMVATFGTDSFDDACLSKGGSLARVSIRGGTATSLDGISRVSLSHLPLIPHTDSTHMKAPHQLVAFQCVRPDSKGGETRIVPVDDILRELGETEADLLREPVYPFGDDRRAVLAGGTTDPQIRYFDGEVGPEAVESNDGLSFRYRWALKAMDSVLREDFAGHRFRLKAGQILFMNNVKVLHGRSGFANDSDRLLFRVRMRAPSLENNQSSLQETIPAADDQHTPHLSLQPGEIDRKLIDLLVENDRIDDAMLLCTTHLAQTPDDLDARFILAELYEQADRLDGAIAQYASACEIDRTHVEVFKKLGDLLLATGRFDDALHAFEQHLHLVHDDFDVELSLSSLHWQLGDHASAREALVRATAAHPILGTAAGANSNPTILIARGFQNSISKLEKGSAGRFRMSLDGGHLEAERLLGNKDCNSSYANILNDNLDGLQRLPKIDLILNSIGCADSESDSLLALARFCDRLSGVPVVNDPRRVFATAKDRLYQRLSDVEGIVFPKTERVKWEGTEEVGLLRRIFGLGFRLPLEVRPVANSLSAPVHCDTEKSLIAYFVTRPTGTEHYVVQYQAHQHRSGAYNRLRMLCLDGRFYPIANMFDVNRYGEVGTRSSLMEETPWIQDEERAYLDDPFSYIGGTAFNALRRIRELVGLDICSIDFSIMPNGDVRVLDLSAAVSGIYEPYDNFPYVRPYMQSIHEAFRDMIRHRLNSGQKDER